MSVDFSQLQEEVQEYWESNGIEFLDHDYQSGPNIPEGGFTETSIKPEYQTILDDPMLCIEELGFSSLSEYVDSKREDTDEKVGIQLGYSRISKYRTKFFFQSAGRDLEFYIDRDPSTSIATLWLNPGVTEATQAFLGALTLEYRRAEKETKRSSKK